MPDFTMVACARAVVLAGLEPVFVDCREDLLIDPELVDVAAAEGASALMPVHIYGRSCDMAAIMDFANKYYLYVIEDLAEAHGLPPHPGTDAACWSFYRNKVVAGEEGGTVAFQCPEAAERARSLRSLGFTPEHDFKHVPRGHNYRLSNAHASLVLGSLATVAENLKCRRELEAVYDDECPDEWQMPKRDVPWVYDLRVRGLSEDDRYRIVSELNRLGIAARHPFQPMSEQPEFKGCRVVTRKDRKHYSVAREMASQCLYLPLTPGLDPDVAVRAFDVIKSIVG